MTVILRSLLANWPAKAVSLLLATVLWLIISSGTERIGTFPGGVAIGLTNVPAGQVAILEHEEVIVTVVADRALWQRFSAETFRATVNLDGASSGVQDRLVTVTSLIPGVQITKVEPERVLVRLEPLVSKMVPLEAIVSGSAASGFTTGGVTLDPAQVQLSGPASLLEKIDQVQALVSINGERSDVQTEALVKLPVPGLDHGLVLSVLPETVVATVSIVRAANVKSVGIVVATEGTPPAGFAVSGITATPSVVTVTGTATAIGSITQLRTKPVVLSELRESSQIPVELELPENVRLLEPTPTAITVVIDVTESETTRVLEIPITVTGLDPALRLSAVSPATIQVQCTGTTTVLAQLGSRDVTASVSLPTGATAGQHTVRIEPDNIIAPEGITVQSVLPTQLSVTLSNQ